MMKYTVIIEYINGRTNTLGKWANDADEAIRLAMRDWGNPSIYKSVTANKG